MQGCQAPNARSRQVTAATLGFLYLHKVLQDNHPDVKITKEAMQVWAEALDAWLQQLAQEIVHEQTSQALTPANVQASLQRLLAKGDTSVAASALTESVAKHPNTGA